MRTREWYNLGMPHLHTEPGQHDHTASAYIVRTDGPEPTVMLHEHKKLGILLQFGGHIELDETPWQGLVRELDEEVGYQIDQLAVLQPRVRFSQKFHTAMQHPLPFDFNTHLFKAGLEHFHSDTAYALVANVPPRGQINPGESAAIHQYTAAQLAALPSTEIYDHTRASALFVLTDLLIGWEAAASSEWPA
jgi:8-oxo-dGTP pyrophosphatase MutT (NUDIX family)